MSFLFVLTIVFEFIPVPLMRLFNASDHMMSMGIVAIRACVVSLTLGGASIILSSAMTALNHPKYTLIVNVFRGFIFLCSAFYVLSAVFGDINKVWFAVPCAELLSVFISVYLYIRMKKEIGRAHV